MIIIFFNLTKSKLRFEKRRKKNIFFLPLSQKNMSVEDNTFFLLVNIVFAINFLVFSISH